MNGDGANVDVEGMLEAATAAEAAAGGGAGGRPPQPPPAVPAPAPPQAPALAPRFFPAHTLCSKCDGSGTLLGRLSKKAYHVFRKAKEAAEAKGDEPPPPPKRPTNPCAACTGTGLALRKPPPSQLPSQPQSPPPPALVVIVGGGIGGCALALALQHRGVAAAVYERDATFGTRAQGYGLTMQQGARTLKQLGFGKLGAYGVSSTQVTRRCCGPLSQRSDTRAI